MLHYSAAYYIKGLAMTTVERVHSAVAKLDDSMSFSEEAAEFMSQAAPYQFNRMIEGLVKEAQRAGITHVDIAFLKEIDMYED
jgi:hypothetical protein